MDIHSVESHLSKVNEYLEELKSNPKIYSKTKVKLRALSKELFRGVNLISEILMEESLSTDTSFEAPGSSDTVEFKLAVDELMSDSQEVTNKASELEGFFYNTNTHALTIQEDEISNKKAIISKYGRVLKAVAQTSTASYKSVSDCAKILSRWYELRFFSAPKRSNNFHYNVRQIRDWVEYIIVAYGWYLQSNNTNAFFNQMNEWCEKLESNPQLIPYALPIEIFEIGKNPSKGRMTYSAMCVWDILFDLGLDELSSKDLGNCRLSKFAIYDRFSSFDSELADSYTYCGTNDVLLHKYKII